MHTYVRVRIPLTGPNLNISPPTTSNVALTGLVGGPPVPRDILVTDELCFVVQKGHSCSQVINDPPAATLISMHQQQAQPSRPHPPTPPIRPPHPSPLFWSIPYLTPPPPNTRVETIQALPTPCTLPSSLGVLRNRRYVSACGYVRTCMSCQVRELP